MHRRYSPIPSSADSHPQRCPSSPVFFLFRATISSASDIPTSRIDWWACSGFPALDDSALSESLKKKRKRPDAGGDETGTEFGEDEPPSKRRGSVRSDLSDPPADTLTPEPFDEEEPLKPADDETPAAPVKGKRGKRSKRRTRKTRDVDEETEGGGVDGADGAADDQLDDEDHADRGEEVDDAEAAAKHEEECKQKQARVAAFGQTGGYGLIFFSNSSQEDVGHGVIVRSGTGICYATGQVGLVGPG